MPLEERDTALIERVFSAPLDIPDKWKAWLISYIESHPPTIPLSQVFGARTQTVTLAQFRSLTPYDGQTLYLEVDAGNNIIWTLQYNEASASSYKWVVLSGAPLFKRYDTAENPGAATGVWADYANGPSITVDQAGIYDIDFGGRGTGNAGGTTSSTGVSNAGSTPTLYVSHAWNDAANAASADRITVAANNDVVKLKHQDGDATRPISVEFRWLRLRPIAIKQ